MITTDRNNLFVFATSKVALCLSLALPSVIEEIFGRNGACSLDYGSAPPTEGLFFKTEGTGFAINKDQRLACNNMLILLYCGKLVNKWF